MTEHEAIDRLAAKDRELEKLRADLHTALVTRDQYFIQLGDAGREVERLRAAIESVRDENRVDRWRAEIEDICARALKAGREG